MRRNFALSLFRDLALAPQQHALCAATTAIRHAHVHSATCDYRLSSSTVLDTDSSHSVTGPALAVALVAQDAAVAITTRAHDLAKITDAPSADLDHL